MSGDDGFGVQGVAGGADGADDVELARAVDRFAQAADMDVDCAGFDMDVAAPNGVQDIFAGEDALGVAEEKFEEAEFGRPEVEGTAVAQNAVRGGVKRDIMKIEFKLGGDRAGTA